MQQNILSLKALKENVLCLKIKQLLLFFHSFLICIQLFFVFVFVVSIVCGTLEAQNGVDLSDTKDSCEASTQISALNKPVKRLIFFFFSVCLF